MSDRYRLGDRFWLENIPYTVVGMTFNGDYNEIPYRALPADLVFTSAEVRSTDIPNQQEAMSILETLSPIFSASFYLST